MANVSILGHLPQEIQTYFPGGATEYSKNNFLIIKVRPYPACFTELGHGTLGEREGTLLTMSDQSDRESNYLFINEVAIEILFTSKDGKLLTLGQINTASSPVWETAPARVSLQKGQTTTAECIAEVKKFLNGPNLAKIL